MGLIIPDNGHIPMISYRISSIIYFTIPINILVFQISRVPVRRDMGQIHLGYVRIHLLLRPVQIIHGISPNITNLCAFIPS